MKQLFFLFALCFVTSLTVNAQVTGGGTSGGAGSAGGGKSTPKSATKYKSPDGAMVSFDSDSRTFTPGTGTTATTFTTDATRKGGFKYNRGANKNRPVDVDVDPTTGDLVIYEFTGGKRGKALERWKKQ